MRSQKGFFVLIVAVALMLNNFFFAINPKAAKPIFDWLDAFVIAAFAVVLIENLLDLVKRETGWHRRAATLLNGALANFYAYNYLAKMAGSGLENNTLWLILVPFVVPMLAYEGLLLIYRSE